MTLDIDRLEVWLREYKGTSPMGDDGARFVLANSIMSAVPALLAAVRERDELRRQCGRLSDIVSELRELIDPLESRCNETTGQSIADELKDIIRERDALNVRCGELVAEVELLRCKFNAVVGYFKASNAERDALKAEIEKHRQRTESIVGGGAEGAGQSANTNSPAPPSPSSESAVQAIMGRIERQSDGLGLSDPCAVEDMIRSAIDAAVREEREACAVACEASARERKLPPLRDGLEATLRHGRAQVVAEECAAAIRARGER